jgi:hypothetical protein
VAMDKILIEKQSSYRTHGRGVDMVPRGRCGRCGMLVEISIEDEFEA